MKQSMLIDPSKCIGCRSCQVACKQWNQLPAEPTVFAGTYENPPAISPVTWMRVSFHEEEVGDGVKWFFGNHRCMHCTDAACITVCPSGAIHHTESGAVALDPNKCIGCNYCVANCPFQVVGFDRRTNLAQKCTFCYERVQDGLLPACVTACPTGALSFGERRTIIGKAQDRVDAFLDAGHNNASVYGLESLGTGVIFALQDDPEHYGLPRDPRIPLSATLWGALFRPLRVLLVVALGLGFWSNRSNSQEAQKAKDDQLRGDNL